MGKTVKNSLSIWICYRDGICYKLYIKLGDSMRKDSEVMVERYFPCLIRLTCHQAKRIKDKAAYKMSGKTFLQKIAIAALNEKSLKDVADVLHDGRNLLGKAYKHIQWYLMVIDAI